MCSTVPNMMMPSYGLKMANLAPYFQIFPTSSQLSALDFQRFQMLNYGPRIQQSMRGYPPSLGMLNYPGDSLLDSYTQACLYKQGMMRTGFVQEEPKPSHSYIALIAMAILASKDQKLVLGDIYQWILDNYTYFRTRGTGWRNSIRHNLSLNECFVKCGRSANGKGHYWAVHEANVDDFRQGDFRRRRAQRKVRRFMGLSFPGEEDEDSPCSSPTPTPNWSGGSDGNSGQQSSSPSLSSSSSSSSSSPGSPAKEMENSGIVEFVKSNRKYDCYSCESIAQSDTSGDIDEDVKEQIARATSILTAKAKEHAQKTRPIAQLPKKRLFDIESLLAPDIKRPCIQSRTDILSADSKLQWTKLWTVCHKRFTPSENKFTS